MAEATYKGTIENSLLTFFGNCKPFVMVVMDRGHCRHHYSVSGHSIHPPAACGLLSDFCVGGPPNLQPELQPELKV